MSWKIAALAAALLAVAAPVRAAECGLVKDAGFTFEERPSAIVTIPVTINGAPEQFLVDTGGVVSWLSPAIADALKLHSLTVNGQNEFYAADGSRFARFTTVDTLGIGLLKARNYHLLLAPHADPGDPFGGVLAPDLLRNFDLDFDFAHHTLNLMSPKHCEGKVVYWAPAFAVVPFSNDYGGHIEVPVTLDGHDMLAIVDTGSPHTLIRAGMAGHIFGLSPSSPGMEPAPGAGADSLVPAYYRFKALTIGGIQVGNPRLGILLDKAEQAFWKKHNDWIDHDAIYGLQFKQQPIILGMDVLTRLHLYIAYDEKKLYVTTADASYAKATSDKAQSAPN